ncbi:hypothetical protein KKP97_04115 [Methanothermococcus sp. SCGC AD-155-C09]|nr:hypothetical protein [Methanothermococcus sp. SCGC AD-155-C09]
MLKRWDTRNYDIKLILEVFDWINVPFESIGIIKEGSQYKDINKGIDYKRIRKAILKISRDKSK